MLRFTVSIFNNKKLLSIPTICPPAIHKISLLIPNTFFTQLLINSIIIFSWVKLSILFTIIQFSLKSFCIMFYITIVFNVLSYIQLNLRMF